MLKAFHHSAQGCSERATLGQHPNISSTLKGLNQISLHVHYRAHGAIPRFAAQVSFAAIAMATR
jgi:hypothetical protein